MKYRVYFSCTSQYYTDIETKAAGMLEALAIATHKGDTLLDGECVTGGSLRIDVKEAVPIPDEQSPSNLG